MGHCSESWSKHRSLHLCFNTCSLGVEGHFLEQDGMETEHLQYLPSLCTFIQQVEKHVLLGIIENFSILFFCSQAIIEHTSCHFDTRIFLVP